MNQQLAVNTKVRTRMAPSPTGYLHVGGARTALYNFLFAKQNKGDFILRIEDTDKLRSKKEYEKDIVESLKWLGLNWDEFYRQSDRLNIYQSYLKKLLTEKKAFYCCHTKDDLDKERNQLKLAGKPQVHWCDHKKFEFSQGVIRLAVKQGIEIEFDDLIRGKIKISTDTIGDFVIAKNLKEPLYNFAAAVDDLEMNITHVIRGEEHLSNTPKQILIYLALNKNKMTFAHLPLILGSDRSKLSKRHGATSLKQFQNEGYLPQALLNFLLLLGWHPSDNQEIYSLEEMILKFSIKRVQKSPAIFDLKKLNSLNSYYLRSLNYADFATFCVPYLVNGNLIKKKEDGNFIVNETGKILSFEKLSEILSLEKKRLKKLCDIVESVDFAFKKTLNYEKELLFWKNQKKEDVKNILTKIKEKILSLNLFDKNALKEILEDLSKQTKDRGLVYWPLRVALSGKDKSPDPTEIAEILGKEQTLDRIDEALRKI